MVRVFPHLRSTATKRWPELRDGGATAAEGKVPPHLAAKHTKASSVVNGRRAAVDHGQVGGAIARSEPRAGNDAAWSHSIVDAAHDRVMGGSSLGLRFRGPVAGPEQILVEAFLDVATTQIAPGRSLTVFVQPAIETGFPDLVAVVWRTAVARAWRAERERLRAPDLRLLHLLATQGASDLVFLQEVFGKGLHGMLARLEDAGVVAVGKSKCRTRKLSRIFAVERIIAVEAKVSDAQRALQQAGANTWYSSESHALFPRTRTGERVRVVASALGVGVIGFEHDHVTQIHEACVRSVPLSYGSWLFNEWTWRIARNVGTL